MWDPEIPGFYGISPLNTVLTGGHPGALLEAVLGAIPEALPRPPGNPLVGLPLYTRGYGNPPCHGVSGRVSILGQGVSQNPSRMGPYLGPFGGPNGVETPGSWRSLWRKRPFLACFLVPKRGVWPNLGYIQDIAILDPGSQIWGQYGPHSGPPPRYPLLGGVGPCRGNPQEDDPRCVWERPQIWGRFGPPIGPVWAGLRARTPDIRDIVWGETPQIGGNRGFGPLLTPKWRSSWRPLSTGGSQGGPQDDPMVHAQGPCRAGMYGYEAIPQHGHVPCGSDLPDVG